MTEDLTRWTCNRCGRSALIPSHHADGARAGAPGGWTHIDARNDRAHSGDLCSGCSSMFVEFWGLGRDPADAIQSDAGLTGRLEGEG